MNTRLRQILDEAVDHVEDQPGDLDAVRARAHQRTRRQRAGVAGAVAAVLAAVALVVVPQVGDPTPPVLAPTDEEQALHLRFMPALSPEEEAPDMDEVATLLASDPAITDVRVWSVDEVADRMREFADDFPEESLPLVVDVTVTADEPIRDVAIRLHRLTDGNVQRGQYADAITYIIGVGPDVDPEAAVSPTVEVATFDVAGETLALEVWQIEDGGICYGVGVDVWCDADSLLIGHGFGARVLSTPSPEVTCLWGAVAVDADEVTLRFTEGETAAAIGDAPDLMLSRGFIGCVEGDVMPVEGEARGPGGSSSWTSDPGSWHGEWPRPIEEDDGPDDPQPVTEVQHLTDIPVEGADRHHPLEVWRDEDGRLCIELGDRRSCDEDHTDEHPVPEIRQGGSFAAGNPMERCAWGQVHPTVTTVELDLDDGTTIQAETYRADEEFDGAAVFATCWIGEQQVTGIRDYDGTGDLVGEFPEQ